MYLILKADTATAELNEALEKIKNLEKEIVKLQTELKNNVKRSGLGLVVSYNQEIL